MNQTMMKNRLLPLGLVTLAAFGCTNDRRPIDVRDSKPTAAAPAAASPGAVRAVCTVAPECPPSGSKDALTTVRSGHTWTVENATAGARDFIVVLEISDDLGHVKRKEVPGQVKARSKVEDSTSIELVTTYRQAGTVEAQARTTVRMGEETLAANAQTCGFEVR